VARLFPGLRPAEQLRADALVAVGGRLDSGYTQVSNMELPAGYTYFAQFVLHDLTYATPSRLILRTLYGGGQTGSPELYEEGGRLRVGRSIGEGDHDLPRDRRGHPLIADQRNDQTIMVGQIHAAFADFHNALLDRAPSRQDAFHFARRNLECLFRTLVLNDLLPRLVDPGVLGDLRANSDHEPIAELPVEFTLAAGRFGHALVKPRYRISDRFQQVLFRAGSAPPFSDLRGQQLDADHAIDWAHFLPIGSANVMQRAARIRPKVCRPLHTIPGRAGGAARSIVELTLRQGELSGLPSGEQVARALGLTPVEPWLDVRELETPLWIYVLHEADRQQHGRRLGTVGSTIFASVLLGAARGDEGLSTERQLELGDVLAAIKERDVSSVVALERRGRLPFSDRAAGWAGSTGPRALRSPRARTR
jgi:hypothetical protein